MEHTGKECDGTECKSKKSKLPPPQLTLWKTTQRNLPQRSVAQDTVQYQGATERDGMVGDWIERKHAIKHNGKQRNATESNGK